MKNCLQYNFYISDDFTASGKSRIDISNILKEEHIEDLYSMSPHKSLRFLSQLKAVLRIKNIKVLFFQYPAVRPNFIRLIHNIYHKHIKMIAYIHDLYSIRTHDSGADELTLLSCFDCLISHNEAMTQHLKAIGYSGEIIELELFDYLHDCKRPIRPSQLNSSVCFAGNLNKSVFLLGLNKIKNLHFHLYGTSNAPEALTNTHIEYHGCYPSDEIPYILEGAFGLVWDGDSIDTCSGDMGNYLKYNNPHKLSLYIAAGKPVIVWKQSAVANFVTNNKIGIAVQDLNEAARIIENMSASCYSDYIKQVLIVKEKLSQGYYTKQAMNKSLSLFIKG